MKITDCSLTVVIKDLKKSTYAQMHLKKVYFQAIK